MWIHSDWNSACGYDYWETADNRSYNGRHSAWCSQVGRSSINSVANWINRYYDQSMEAFLRLPLDAPPLNISPYESVSMSFCYWANTDTLNDNLTVNCIDRNGTATQLWKQPAASSGGWLVVQLGIPLDSVYIEFNFTSDNILGGGPYEGVYVDDVALTGTDSSPPSSSIGSLSVYYHTEIVAIPFNASDVGGSGVDYVELYYRRGTSGTFLEYITTENPSGHWNNSPIPFNSSLTGENGLYQFFTVATDNCSNTEAAPIVCDASTTVDTHAPWSGLTVDGVKGANGWYKSDVTLMLASPYDWLSGIASIEYTITEGPQQMMSWQPYDPTGVLLSLEGTHSVSFKLTDNATNDAVRKSTVLIDKTPPSTNIKLVGTMGNEGWYKGSVVINLTASDATSGISSIFYCIDSGSMEVYSDDLSITNGGATNISYYSTDMAGNSDAADGLSQLFKLDPAGPACEILGAPSAFTTPDVSISWQGQDNDSGMDHFEVSFDGADFAQVGNLTSTEATLEDGEHTFDVRAIDIAGNIGPSSHLDFTVDANILSPGGPMGPWLVIAIIAIVIVLILLLTLWRRKKTASPSGKAPVR